MDWRKIYKMPFRSDDIGYVWSDNETMTLMFNCENDVDLELVKNVVDKLNGNTNIKFNSNFTILDNINFYYNGEFVFCVRGWGYMTGTGCHNLSFEEASKTQDDFANWILETLNN